MDNSLKHSTIVDYGGLASLSISSLSRSSPLFLYFSVFSNDSFCRGLWSAVDAWVLTIT